jgi:hypothetical protein
MAYALHFGGNMREPPSPDDRPAWDIEALKLAVINPHRYNEYASASMYHGTTGLALLGFFEPKGGFEMGDDEDNLNQAVVRLSHMPEKLKPHGEALVHACRRTYQKR